MAVGLCSLDNDGCAFTALLCGVSQAILWMFIRTLEPVKLRQS